MTTDQINPYATFLGDNDPVATISATPTVLAHLLAGVPDEALTRSPADRKWSIRHIACHLADTELVFGFRLRQTVAQNDHIIQPFDQDAWAQPLTAFSTQEGLDAFTAFRRWNLLFVRAAGPSVRSKRVTHPERGEMTFQNILETMAGHDINHRQQIERLVTPAAV